MEQIKDTNQEESKLCIKCGARVYDKYCHKCGQKTDVPRITFKSFFNDFLDKTYGLDGTFPKTVIGLTVRPGKVISEYISGIRGKYVGPVGYFFLLYAIVFIVSSLLDVDLQEIGGDQDKIQGAMGVDPAQQTDDQRLFQEQMNTIIFKYLNYFTLLWLPFFAWTIKIFYKKPSFNFLENLVFSFYVLSHPLLLNIINLFTFKFFDTKITLLNVAITLTYFTWSTIQVYRPRKVFIGIIKGLLIYLLSFIFFFIAFTIILMLGVIIYKTLINPG
ncbi:DUF3667 domain-containing protein [Fulvivirgaceae bacterium BMA10]|uniref:DUF3667 domain-containing protein n=1 Tax=Splendidivirga corallicola TaxID=3051826 RepID=A0ABT8KHB2_9BACT|nr:DUF3667 domain-containing protein [Fulvivirgaceae bacterium BMA10]